MSQVALGGSAELAAAAARLTPGGVHSNVRLTSPQVHFDRGEGAWLFDVDGNDYVDYLLGQGPAFLGHAPAEVVRAVADAAGRGTVFGAQNALEGQAAELMLDSLGWAEQVRFGLTGTEADQAALRVARAATGRTRFLRFEGHYHGWLDNVLARTEQGRSVPASKGQLPTGLAESVVVPFNDAAAVGAAVREHGDDLAAIILEPVMCNNGVIAPEPGFLAEVRRLATEHGIVLIFDEVITGFRLGLSGAVGSFGVQPDLATYGKALAGGWPVSALAGRADLMGLIGAGGVNHSGTFNAYLPGVAAVVAALTVLRDTDPYQRVAEHGSELQRGLREIAAELDVPLTVQGLPMAFHVSFGRQSQLRSYADLAALDLDGYAKFTHVLARRGVWAASRGVMYVSAAHGERELQTTLDRYRAALRAWTSGQRAE